MLPSSFNKTCCDAQTCPKLNRKKEDASLEEVHQMPGNDKETQMSPVVESPSAQTLIPAKTSEKPTETYLDRNNENISSYLKEFCSSNSSETSLTEFQKSEFMLKCYPVSTTTKKSQPGHQSQLVCRSLHKSTCKKLNLTPSSSCSSLSSEGTHKKKCVSKQNRVQRLQRTPIKNVNISHNETSTNHNSNYGNVWQFLKKLSNSFGQSTEGDDLEDEFFSCNSEGSEDDEKPENLFSCLNPYNSDENEAILQLLEEVENLINKDKRIRDRVATTGEPYSPTKSSSEETTINIENNFKISKQTSSTHLFPPPPPCVCNCRAPFPPNNFTNPASGGAKTVASFFYEGITSLKVASNSNQRILTTHQLADNLSSLCAAADLSILKDDIKSQYSSLAGVNNINNIKMETSTQRLNGTSKPGIDIEFDYGNCHCLCEDDDSFKDCSSGNKSFKTAKDQLPAEFICNCIGHQIILECRQDKTLTLTIFPVAGIKSDLGMEKPCVKKNSFGGQVNFDVCQCPLENKQQYNNINTEPFKISKSSINFLPEPVLGDSSDEKSVNTSQLYQPCLDCLMEYDDEEPNFQNTFPAIQELNKEMLNIKPEAVNLEKPAKPIEVVKSDALQLEAKRDINIKPNEELIKPAERVEAEPLNEQKTLPDIINAEPERVSYKKEGAVKDAEKPLDKTGKTEAPLNFKKEETSSITSSQNIYNLLPEIDESHHDSKELITNDLNDEEEHELAKEELSENRKENKQDENEQNHDKEITTLATLKQIEGNGSYAEMKFFIDSLIMDLEAMDYARRRSQSDKKICKTKKLAHCIRDSFPVTITDVMELGANSLYVKWKVHDCFGIDGYEIYTDGYLSNRFYNSRHVAAVVTPVDITLPHKIALLAVPIEARNKSFDFICDMSEKSNKTHVTASWTPSIFLYDPTSGSAAPSIAAF